MTAAELAEYKKSVLSDLQWVCEQMKNAVLEMPDLEFREKLIFHIDEALRRESINDYRRIRKNLTAVRNIIKQEELTGEIKTWFADVWETLLELRTAIKTQKI